MHGILPSILALLTSDIRPPFLETLHVRLTDSETVPSHEVLEAAPALQKILIGPSDEDNMLYGVASQPVIAALHGGIGLRNLKEITLISCMLGDEHFDDFLKALGDSGMAERMILLSFFKCEIGAEGARSLAKMLHRDGLPGLQKLYLDDNAIRGPGWWFA